MEYPEIDHWPFIIYQDDSGNLYVQDREEGLVFVRGKVNQSRYDLGVIIEEENAEYSRLTDILSPEPPCGFQLLDELSLTEWKSLVRNYLRYKHKGKQAFAEWLEEELYAPLKKMLHQQSWIAESMPYPGAPETDWQDFDRALRIHEKIK